MSVKIIRNERDNHLYVTVISETTKLFDSFDRSLLVYRDQKEKNTAEELKVLDAKKRAEAEQEVVEWISAFKRRDEDIASLYNVKMKSFKISFDEVSHFSASEVQALENKIDMNELRQYARSLGIITSSAEDSEGNSIESPFDTSKRIMSELLTKEPSIDLGLFLFKMSEEKLYKGSKSNYSRKTRDGHSLKIKAELKDSIIAIDTYDEGNVLFNDGSLIGRPFTNKKVEKFLDELSNKLNEGSFEEILEIRNRLLRFKKSMEDGVIDRLLNKIWNNPLFADRFSDNENPVTLAYISIFNEENFEQKRSTLEGYIDSFLSDSDEDSPWQEKNIGSDMVKAEVLSKMEKYISTLAEHGDSDAGGLRNALESLFADVDAAKKLYSEVKPWILAKLKEEKKPVTIKRIKTKLEEFNSAHEKSSRFMLRSYGNDSKLQKMFSKELLEEAVKEEKSPSEFKAKRIKKGTRASDALLEKWASLSEEDKTYLFGVALSDSDSNENLSYFFSSGAGKNLDILAMAIRLHGKKLLAYRDMLKSTNRLSTEGSYILRAMIELGAPIDKLPWEDISGYNIADLISFVPPNHIAKAIELFAQRASSEGDMLLLSEALDKISGKISRETIAVIYESLSTLMTRGSVAYGLIEKYSEMFLAKDKRFYNLLVACAIKNPDSNIVLDPMVALSKNDPELAFFMFSWANKSGDKGLANSFLKIALEAENLDKDVPSFLGIGSYGNLTAPSDLFTATNVAGDTVYSDTLIQAIQKRNYIFPANIRSSQGTQSSALKSLTTIFSGSSFSMADQEEMIKEMYGEDSDEYFQFKGKELSESSKENIIDKLLKGADEARKADHQESLRQSFYRSSSNYTNLDIVSRLEPRHLQFLDKLLSIDSCFATLENINKAPESVLKSISPDNQAACAMLYKEAFKKYSNHNHHDDLEKYLSIFSENTNLSKRIIQRAEMKPLQTVAAARALEKVAVEENAYRLVAMAESSEKALDSLLKIVKVELEGKLATKMASRPNGIVARVVAGDLSLSEKDWNTLFSSFDHLEEVFIKLFDEQTTLRKIIALAETFDCELDSIISSGFLKLRVIRGREQSLAQDLVSLASLGNKNSSIAKAALEVMLSADMKISELEEAYVMAEMLEIDLTEGLNKVIKSCISNIEDNPNHVTLLKHFSSKRVDIKISVLKSLSEASWIEFEEAKDILISLDWLEDGQDLLMKKKKEEADNS